MAKTQKHYKKDYTQLQNNIIDDKSLSLKALGLWLYMWRQSNDWYFTAELIAENRKDGVTAIRNALKELEEHKYLQREFIYVDGIIDNVIYHLTDIPFSDENHVNRKRTIQKD